MLAKFTRHNQQQEKYKALHTAWRHGDRHDTMRLRAGWHNTQSPADEEARISIDGYLGDDPQGNSNWNEIMTIRADGKVGIGTSDPLDALHVIGKTYVEGSLKVGAKASRFYTGENGQTKQHAPICTSKILNDYDGRSDDIDSFDPKTMGQKPCASSSFDFKVDDHGNFRLS